MEITLVSHLENAVVESLGDGPGIRLVVFISGCPHRCKGCHNPETWNIENGIKYPVEEVANHLVNKYHSGRYQGITFSGGDPLYQSDALYELLTTIRREIPNINIWCYSGYRYEEIKGNKVLNLIDVLVDGRFEQDKTYPAYPRKKFRGSSNQRILYLKDGCIIKEE